MYVLFHITFRRGTQGTDSLCGIPRVKPEGFNEGILFLRFLPKKDIKNMYHDDPLADISIYI